MYKYVLIVILFFALMAQAVNGQSIDKQIDSLLDAKTNIPFNGIILISQNGKTIYKNKIGFSDIENQKILDWDNQFIIGSISKQFTAVLVLREYDKGRIKMDDAISKYLPELTQDWAKEVTVEQLLTHMHGIRELDKPLAFKASSKYEYSQIGYDLLAQILEKVTGKSFAILSSSLLAKCGMKNSTHPLLYNGYNLANGYNENENGDIFLDTAKTKYVAAGGFISTVQDLLLWNKWLHGGKLLKNSTYDLMIAKKQGAIRNHPVFGITEYGYGITTEYKNGLLQLGQTGYAPGYVSMDFYFPETKTSIIVLENITYDTDNLKNTFYYHSHILDIVKESLSK